VTHRIDPAVNRVESAGPHPVVDGGHADAERGELRARDHPVLRRRQARDDVVRAS
jgi:hypothetical protein